MGTDTDTDKKWVIKNCVEVFILPDTDTDTDVGVGVGQGEHTIKRLTIQLVFLFNEARLFVLMRFLCYNRTEVCTATLTKGLMTY